MSEIVLRNDGARLEVASLGAEARAWRVGERDLLWPGDPEIWPDVSPILYPVVGWTRDAAQAGGAHYPLGVHGFARFETFTITVYAGDFARLMLSDNERTRTLYPFAFTLAVEYHLTGDALAVAIEVGNPGGQRAPYACGLHPGFRWPLGDKGRDGAFIRFEKEERAQVPAIAPGGFIGAGTKPVPLKGRDLPLSDALFAADALCFLDCASRELAFVDASGASVTMEYPDYPHAALWTRPGAPFLCLECWTGYSDPQGFAGDLFEKPSMRVLEPGARARHTARFVYRAG